MYSSRYDVYTYIYNKELFNLASNLISVTNIKSYFSPIPFIKSLCAKIKMFNSMR